MRAHLPVTRAIVALAVFAVSLVAFDRGFFAVAQRVHFIGDLRGQVRRKLESLPNKGQYQVLVLGTSRAFEAVNPTLLRDALGVKAYKEAHRGRALRYNYRFYQLYKEIVGTPRLVIYGIDYFIFDTNSEPQMMRELADKPEDAANDVKRGALLMLANKRTDDRAQVAFLQQLQDWLVPPPRGTPDPAHNVQDMERYEGIKGSEVVSGSPPSPLPQIAFRRFPGLEGSYLMKFLDETEADGVEVMFVYPPDYIATYHTNFEHDLFIEYFRQLLAGRHHCTLYNYNEPSRFPLDHAEYFLNGGWGMSNSHLSYAGAAAFQRAVFLPDVKAVWARVRAAH